MRECWLCQQRGHNRRGRIACFTESPDAKRLADLEIVCRQRINRLIGQNTRRRRAARES
jgi:hypothetical protein